MSRKTSLRLIATCVLLTLCVPAGLAANGFPLYTTADPSMVTADGKIFMVYRGAEFKTDPNSLYWAVYDGKSWTDMKKIPAKYGVMESPANAALAYYQGKIIMAYQGVQKKHTIYWAQLDPKTLKWTDEQVLIDTEKLGLYLVGSPALSAVNNTLYMSYQGGTPGYTIYWASFNGRDWKNLSKVLAHNKS